tara:strand:- start:263 stop:475 length:213 start_codon:yes stop_codon:yes gene_type:complete
MGRGECVACIVKPLCRLLCFIQHSIQHSVTRFIFQAQNAFFAKKHNKQLKNNGLKNKSVMKDNFLYAFCY